MDSVDSSNNQTSYRSIFKATSLFGGVQIYQIIINVVKSKFIAVLLGPLGVGVMGLYYSALQFIQSLTAMGLQSSAVRDVSEANGSGDYNSIAKVVITLRRLVWCTGLLGLLIVIVSSPLLSRTSFGDNVHVIPFICLSITLLLDQICCGQRVVLQGMRRLKHLALASAIGSTVSLFVSVPVYYIYGVKGIVPTLILNSITLLLLTWYFARQVKLPVVSINTKEILLRGKGMLTLGLAMSWSNIMVFGSAYLLRWFIRSESGTEEVGLYSAGFTIISTYVGMFFTAIGTDYYPRLAAINNDNIEMKKVVNQQGEIAALLLVPLLLLCIVFMPLVIRILYSSQFLSANYFIIYAAMGMLFKLCSWLIAYQFIAKRESKLFIINETITNFYFLVFNIIGYKLYGLSGLGIAFTLSYLIYFIQVYVIAKRRYHYGLSKAFKKIILIGLCMLMLCYLVTLINNQSLTYFLGIIIITCSGLYSFKELDNRMRLLEYIKKIL